MNQFPPTNFDSWTRFDGASFAKRYFESLWRVARSNFNSIDESTAQDLAQGFLTRELAPDRVPVFERFQRGHGAAFRSYLGRSFYRYCRDELLKERRRPILSIDDLHDELPQASANEFDRLITRDFLNSLRQEILASPRLTTLELAYFKLKWPESIDDEPAKDKELERALGLSRGEVRGLKRRVIEELFIVVKRRAQADGHSTASAESFVVDYLTVLSCEDSGTEGEA